MKRFALALVLCFLVCCLASAQKGTSNSSSSSSGSSTSGYGGGGGTYHSSGSGSGSSGYSGGSAGYSGGSHSSSSSSSHSGGYSGNGSSGPHSTTNSPSSASSGGNSHSSSRDTSSHSNLGVGASGSNPRGSGTGNSVTRDNSSHSNIRLGTTGWELNRGHSGSGFGRPKTLPTPGPQGLGRPDSVQDPAWLHQPIHVSLPPENLDKHTRQQIFAERVRAIGLEPSKSSFKSAMASIGDQESKRVNWIGKLFGDKPKSPNPSKPPEQSQLRPCKGKECKEIPIPPKPCVGAKCPKQPGTTAKTVCSTGFPGANGSCQPWGYMENCTYPYNLGSLGHCHIRWASVHSSYCWQILRELSLQQKIMQETRLSQTRACSVAPQSPECAKLTQDLDQALARIQQLQQQYRMCAAATGRSAPTDMNPWSFNSWPSVLWP